MGKVPVLATVLTILGLAGCAEQGGAWHKPGADSDQWAIDRAECSSYARHKAEEDYRADSTANAGGGVNDASDFSALMSTHDAKRNTQAIYERCLKRKGYSRSAPAEKTGKSA